MSYEAKFEISEYRKFVREAAPFVSLVIGRKIRAADADLLSEEAMLEIAEKIDRRVADLNVSIQENRTNGFPTSSQEKVRASGFIFKPKFKVAWRVVVLRIVRCRAR